MFIREIWTLFPFDFVDFTLRNVGEFKLKSLTFSIRQNRYPVSEISFSLSLAKYLVPAITQIMYTPLVNMF